MLRYASVCVILASVQASLAFVPSPASHVVRPGSRRVGAASPGLRMQQQSEPAIARRSLLSAAGASVLLGGSQHAAAADGKGKAKKLAFVKIEDGLSYILKKEPDGGPLAKLGDYVVINYIAYLKDGTIFDNTIKRKKPLAFQIGKKQVVPGLEAGIMGMKPGEQRQLFLKADPWGYGEDGVCFESKDDEEEETCLVPPDTDLVYDVTLVNTGPAPNN